MRANCSGICSCAFSASARSRLPNRLARVAKRAGEQAEVVCDAAFAISGHADCGQRRVQGELSVQLPGSARIGELAVDLREHAQQAEVAEVDGHACNAGRRQLPQTFASQGGSARARVQPCRPNVAQHVESSTELLRAARKFGELEAGVGGQLAAGVRVQERVQEPRRRATGIQHAVAGTLQERRELIELARGERSPWRARARRVG